MSDWEGWGQPERKEMQFPSLFHVCITTTFLLFHAPLLPLFFPCKKPKGVLLNPKWVVLIMSPPVRHGLSLLISFVSCYPFVDESVTRACLICNRDLYVFFVLSDFFGSISWWQHILVARFHILFPQWPLVKYICSKQIEILKFFFFFEVPFHSDKFQKRALGKAFAHSLLRKAICLFFHWLRYLGLTLLEFHPVYCKIK